MKRWLSLMLALLIVLSVGAPDPNEPELLLREE